MMHLSRSVTAPTRFYSLGGEVIKSVTEAQYLGVNLSNCYGTRTSQWKSHIVDTAAKTNRRLGYLRRNLKGCPYRLRELAYVTLVRSTLEYCGSVWDTTVQCESETVEMVQHRGARWARGAHGIVSITELLKQLKWQTLADRREVSRLNLFYKILNNDIDIPPECVDIRLQEGRVTRKQQKQHNLTLKRIRGKDQFSPLWKGTIARTIPVWNSLPKDTAEVGSFITFKSRLSPAP